MKFRPINDFVLVRKCTRPDIVKDGVTIYRTDESKAFTNWAKIIEVGPKCKEIRNEDAGKFVWCPEWEHGQHNVYEDFFAVREKLLIKKLGALFNG